MILFGEVIDTLELAAILEEVQIWGQGSFKDL